MLLLSRKDIESVFTMKETVKACKRRIYNVLAK